MAISKQTKLTDYEGFVEKLASLGAKISREEVPDPEEDEN